MRKLEMNGNIIYVRVMFLNVYRWGVHINTITDNIDGNIMDVSSFCVRPII